MFECFVSPRVGRKFFAGILGKHLSTRVPCGPGSGVLSLSCQEGARRECVDPNYIPIRQQMIVVGDEGPFRCCAQRCEFSIVPIPDEDVGVRIDGAGKLPFWLEENSDPLQSRRGIRRKIISVSRWVGLFQIS